MPGVLDALTAAFPEAVLGAGQDAQAPGAGEPAIPANAGGLDTDDTTSYSGRIAAIKSQHLATVQDAEQQQQYLRAQYQEAAEAEELALRQADADFTPGWRQAGLPAKASLLSFNELQVQQKGLANPKAVVGHFTAYDHKEVLSPLQVTEFNNSGNAPHYYSSTGNLQVRNSLVPAKRRAEAGQGSSWRALSHSELQGKLAASSARRRAMSQTMPGDQWDAEQKVITSMQHKLAFLRNPRFTSPDKHPTLPSTAHSPRATRRSSPVKGITAARACLPFRAEPSRVVFDAFEVGQHCQAMVHLRNLTSLGQHIRLLPSSSPCFTYSSLMYAPSSEPGLVAPGMHVSVQVTFTPASLADLGSSMLLETEQGMLEVPLLAKRPPAKLNLLKELHVGPTLTGNTGERIFTVRNEGGASQFWFSASELGDASLVEGDTLQVGAFTISPATFALGLAEEMQLHVSFSPKTATEHTHCMWLTCESGTTETYQLTGTGAALGVHLLAINDRQPTQDELSKPVWFGPVAVGAQQQHMAKLYNGTALPVPFCWQQTDQPVMQDWPKAKHELTDGAFGAMQFQAEPVTGVLLPGEEANVTLTFAPAAQHRYLSWAQLVVDTQVAQTAAAPVYNHRVLELALEGRGVPCAVDIWPPALTCPGLIQLGQVVTQPITVTNTTAAPAHVTWTSSELAVAVVPATAVVLAGSPATFGVHIEGQAMGLLQAIATCSVQHGNSCAVNIQAQVQGPSVRFEEACLDFGLLQVGRQAVQQLTIYNTSQYHHAWWTLQQAPQHAQQASTDFEFEAQHTQHGMPAALHLKKEELMQQLQDSQTTADTDLTTLDNQADIADGVARANTADALAASALQPTSSTADDRDAETAAVTALGTGSLQQASVRAADAAVGMEANTAEDGHDLEQGNPFLETGHSNEGKQAGPRLQLMSDCGRLEPGASVTVQVVCKAESAGHLNCILELSTGNGRAQQLTVTAVALQPAVALSTTQLDVGICYLGVPVWHDITMTNLTMLPTAFAWDGCPADTQGRAKGQITVALEPEQGLLLPGAQQTVRATFLPTSIGQAEALVACSIGASASPVGFSTHAQVRGLAVNYTIQSPAAPLPNYHPPEALGSHLASPQISAAASKDLRSVIHTDSKALVADFGSCSIGQTKQLLLVVQNQTPLAAPISLYLETFQASLSSTTAASGSASASTAVPMASAGTTIVQSQLMLWPGSQGIGVACSGLAGLTTGLSATRGNPLASQSAAQLMLDSSMGLSDLRAAHSQGSMPGGLATHKRRQSLAPLKLSSASEQTCKFASVAGQTMTRHRASLHAAKQVMGDKGIAIELGPTTGLLPPWGHFTCALSCSTGMCGAYADTLHVQVGELPVQKIPVRVCVGGTPLVMQPGRLLLPGYSPKKPQAASQQPHTSRTQSQGWPALPQGSSMQLKGSCLHLLGPATQSLSTALLQPSNTLRSQSLSSEPETAPQLQQESKAEMAVDFGQLLANTKAERSFHVFNTSCMPVQLDWTFFRYGLPGSIEVAQNPAQAIVQPLAATSTASDMRRSHTDDSCHAHQVVAADWSVDEDAASVSLKLTSIGHAALQPFVIQPSSAMIPGDSSAKFTIRFTSPDAMLHEGYLLGSQRLALSEDPPLKLHCAVPRGEGSDQPDSAQLSTDSVSDSRPGMAREGMQQAATDSDSLLVSCQISGGFHSYAGPPPTPLQPLRVPLTAHVIQPLLEPEFPDATDSLEFNCCATHNPDTHPSYIQPMVLTNMHSCALQFRLSIHASMPFQIVKVLPGAVSRLAGLQENTRGMEQQGTKRAAAAAKGLTDDSVFLRPHEHVTVYVRYAPEHSKQLEATGMQTGSLEAPEGTGAQALHSSGLVQQESVAGQLLVKYQNDESQRVPLRARCLHPAVQPAVSRLDFGAVHLHSAKILELEVSNPTTVDATWSAQVEACSRLGDSDAAASVSFATRAVPKIATGLHPDADEGMFSAASCSSTFSCVPAVGTLSGRGLGMPKKLQLAVKFSPSHLGMYSAFLILQVAHGSTCKVALAGEGTLTEADEVQAVLKVI